MDLASVTNTETSYRNPCPSLSSSLSFIRTDSGRLINEQFIKWIEKYDNECIQVCNRVDGCFPAQTHWVCKAYNPTSYAKLNQHFQDNH